MRTTAVASAARVNPFPGIVPFDERDAWCFFGRDSEIEEILDRLSARRLVAVIGVSGCGKSSLVRAGVVPVLRLGAAENLPGRWRIHTFTPGNDPSAALRTALQAPPPWPATSFHLVTLAKQTLQPNEKLLLVIDQFEELFRFRAETQPIDAGNEADLFVNLLLNAIDQREVPIYVLLTMRSDFLGDCAQFRNLPEALNNCYYLVPRMTRAQQQEAIERPLVEQGHSMAPALVQRLLNDSAEDPDQLPILQHLLKRLWENRNTRIGADSIDFTDYDAVGGWQNALESDANQVLVLFPAEQDGIRRLFQWITGPGPAGKPIRRPRPFSECAEASGLTTNRLAEILAAFAERGLLRRAGSNGDSLIDLPHESMIRHWKRLRDWTVEESASSAVYRRLVDSVENKRSLYRGPELAEALKWQTQQQPNQLWASRYEEAALFREAIGFIQRSKWQSWLLRTVLALSVAVAILLAVIFYSLYREADEQKRIADSRGLAAASQVTRTTQSDLSLLLGIEAYRSEPTYEARSNLLSGLQKSTGVLAYLNHDAAVFSVAMSPDGKTLATASADDMVRLWDVATRRVLGEALVGHTDSVFSVAFSPDGRTLASASADKTVRLWDVATRRALGDPLLGHNSYVDRVVFSPDGKMLASASHDKTVRLWDVAGRRALGEALVGHTDPVHSVAFSPDGKTLASASADKTVRLWDVTTQHAFGEPLLGHASLVNHVVFSPDGKTLATASDDKTVRLWDVASRRTLGEPLLGHTSFVHSVAFTPDGKTLASASADKTIRLWDVATRRSLSEPLLGHTDSVRSAVFSADGKTLATASSDKTVRLWDFDRRALGEPLLGHEARINFVTFSPDGKTLATASDDKTVRLWELGTRRALGAPLLGHSARINCVSFSPDGKTLATASDDKTVMLWDVPTRRALGEPLIGHTRAVESVAFSPDGETLASASEDKTVRLWNFDTRRAVGDPLRGHANSVYRVTFSPDGKSLATASEDKTVRLWDLATRRAVGDPLRGHTDAVWSVAFNPDSKTLASAADDKTVWLWDLATKHTLGKPLLGHTNSVWGVAFSFDGKTLASASADETVRLWDVTTGRALGEPLLGHTNYVDSVAFSPDGKTLASASDDQTVRLWDVDLHSWIARTCSIVNRNLSLAEWQQYLGIGAPYRRTCPDLPPGKGAPAK